MDRVNGGACDTTQISACVDGSQTQYSLAQTRKQTLAGSMLTVVRAHPQCPVEAPAISACSSRALTARLGQSGGGRVRSALTWSMTTPRSGVPAVLPGPTGQEPGSGPLVLRDGPTATQQLGSAPCPAAAGGSRRDATPRKWTAELQRRDRPRRRERAEARAAGQPPLRSEAGLGAWSWSAASALAACRVLSGRRSAAWASSWVVGRQRRRGGAHRGEQAVNGARAGGDRGRTRLARGFRAGSRPGS